MLTILRSRVPRYKHRQWPTPQARHISLDKRLFQRLLKYGVLRTGHWIGVFVPDLGVRMMCCRLIGEGEISYNALYI
jgi:hypothetical protein